MKNLIFIVLTISACALIKAQIKNRPHVTPPSSSYINYSENNTNFNENGRNHYYPNLQQGHYNNSHVGTNGRPFHALNHTNGQHHNTQHVSHQQGYLHNSNWEFENRTLARVQPGICFKEVE